MSNVISDIMNRAAIAAAEVILEVYDRPFVADAKSDGSPVTEADQRAEAVIIEILDAEIGIPILAEESVAAGRIPELTPRYFVVDPLDGTKEFIKRNGEFTVNIAMCSYGRPIYGVVLAPATGDIYWGNLDGAWTGRVVDRAIVDVVPLAVRREGPVRIVASRSHGHAALADLCRNMQVAEDVSVGSSLKFCLLAKGDAELYPRFTPTSEWDTAAGQAVLEAAGGVVIGMDGEPLTCGHPDRNFLNGWFVAAATEPLARRALEEMRRHAE
jgi:3'(2'),5'-bisphosphate nucleotidase